MSRANTVAILKAKPGREADLEALLLSMCRASRNEPGNLRWDIWRDRDDAERFILDELYVDTDAVQAHRATPHFQAYLARIGDLADRIAVVGEPVDVA
jgi:quinol monooxygenase YgiN